MQGATGIGWKSIIAETDLTTLHELIRDFPLGILTTHIPTSVTFNDAPIPSLQVTHVPFHLDVSDNSLGILRGHIGRGGPHAKILIDALARQTLSKSHVQREGEDETEEQVTESEVMVVFNSPTVSYVTPSFYTHTKPTTGKVAPTWFFSAVQVYGTLKVYHSSSSPETKDFLMRQTEALTAHGESHILGFPPCTSWKLSDAPKGFIDMMLPAIIGLKIEIKRIEGRTKVGQEIPPLDQIGCIRGFNALNTDAGRAMAKCIEINMRKHPKRSLIWEEETAKKLVRGAKVESPFGWYYTANKDTTRAIKKKSMLSCLIVALAVSLLLNMWLCMRP